MYVTFSVTKFGNTEHGLSTAPHFRAKPHRERHFGILIELFMAKLHKVDINKRVRCLMKAIEKYYEHIYDYIV